MNEAGTVQQPMQVKIHFLKSSRSGELRFTGSMRAQSMHRDSPLHGASEYLVIKLPATRLSFEGSEKKHALILPLDEPFEFDQFKARVCAEISTGEKVSPRSDHRESTKNDFDSATAG